MKTMVYMIALFPVVYVAGCATMIEKPTRSITISSQPDGADVTVVDSSGETVFAGKTPAVAALKPGAGYFRGQNYTVAFEKPGYTRHETKIKRGVSAWYVAGNFFFGGLIGWLIVDPLTGAMWTLEENVHAELAPLGSSSSAEGTNRLHVVCVDEVPEPLTKHMVRIN